MAKKKDLVIEQGRTFNQIVRWGTEPIIYKAITAITQAAPVRITSASHGIPDGWEVAIVSVKGMTQINASTPPKDKEFVRATKIDSNTIELNSVNSSEFKAYTSGGYIQFATPVDLAGFTGRMKIKDKVGGTVLASTDVVDTPADIITVTLDNVDKTITIEISAADTEQITWKKGVYDLELESGTGVVTALLTGAVSVVQEVTTA